MEIPREQATRIIWLASILYEHYAPRRSYADLPAKTQGRWRDVARYVLERCDEFSAAPLLGAPRPGEGCGGATQGAKTVTEFEETIQLANRVLDRPNADPDDDLGMLAQQFLRAVEARDALARELERLRQALAAAKQTVTMVGSS